jgi:Sulfotransferase family
MTDAPISGLAPGAAVPAISASSGSPVFILTARRSGSTLLRFILDSHPDLACPPETLVGETCATMLRLFYALEHFGGAERTDMSAPPEVSPESLKVIRETLDTAYGRYLDQRGKRRWCDKSLDTYQFADLILRVFPEARFICLVRHCMDVIASGAHACPWGVSRYGFDPFVTQFPGNTVAAIGAYWLSCNRAILEFRDKNPGCCAMVRYEDLVTAPENVMADILSFIGARQAPGITQACFGVPHESRGPGDEKIWFTDRISAGSMGQGVAVPAAALPSMMAGSRRWGASTPGPTRRPGRRRAVTRGWRSNRPSARSVSGWRADRPR